MYKSYVMIYGCIDVAIYEEFATIGLKYKYNTSSLLRARRISKTRHGGP